MFDCIKIRLKSSRCLLLRLIREARRQSFIATGSRSMPFLHHAPELCLRVDDLPPVTEPFYLTGAFCTVCKKVIDRRSDLQHPQRRRPLTLRPLPAVRTAWVSGRNGAEARSDSATTIKPNFAPHLRRGSDIGIEDTTSLLYYQIFLLCYTDCHRLS
jgi:hypothetical protein